MNLFSLSHARVSLIQLLTTGSLALKFKHLYLLQYLTRRTASQPMQNRCDIRDDLARRESPCGSVTTLTDRFAEVMGSSSVRIIEFHFCSMPVTTELQFLELKFTTDYFPCWILIYQCYLSPLSYQPLTQISVSYILDNQKKWFSRCPTSYKTQNILMLSYSLHELYFTEKLLSLFFASVVCEKDERCEN